MSTQATASSPYSNTNNDPINTFTVNGRAVIDWETSDAERHCLVHPDPKTRHIIFEAFLENDMSQRLSFFRLRIPIRHKQLQDITLYIHIPPNHISSLDWDLQYDAADDVRTRLNTNITRLRFNLHRPAQLIVPAQETLQAKRPLTADIIKALKSLAVALNFSVYLEHTTISKTRLQSLTEVISSGQSRPIPRYCDLHRLYAGIGGKSLLPVEEIKESMNSGDASPDEGDSPPSYDEIGPGPPMPPQATGPKRRQGKRNRQSSGTSADNGGSPSNRPSKKGLLEQDPELAETVIEERNGLHLLAQKLFAELAHVNEIVARQGEIIESQGNIIANLKDEIDNLRDQAKTQQDEVANLEQRMDKTDVAVVDLDATVIQHGESLAELEDTTVSLQEYCDEFSNRRAPELEEIRDEVRAEVMVRLRNALESP